MTGYTWTQSEIIAINEARRERNKKELERRERDEKQSPCLCKAGLVDNRCPWHGTPKK